MSRGSNIRHPRQVLPDDRAALAVALMLLAAYLANELIPRRAVPPREPSPVRARLRIDPNTATADELMLLPRIGPKLARNIIVYRERAADAPAFRSVTDLDEVPRIGPVTVAQLRPYVRFE